MSAPKSYVIIDGRDAIAAAITTDDMVDPYRSCIIYGNEEGQEFIASEGGEPEDQCFCRDLDWIVPELNRALERGRAEATERAERAEREVERLSSPGHAHLSVGSQPPRSTSCAARRCAPPKPLRQLSEWSHPRTSRPIGSRL